MKVIASSGKEEVAIVYIADMGKERLVEFVESLQPPIPREKKWVLIVSTLLGCPVGCLFCDSGIFYKGKLSKEEIQSQIDFLVKKRFPDGYIPVEKFKIQFARTGEPAFNHNVLRVLSELPARYNAPGLLPCVSTVAPEGANTFFEKLIEIRKTLYKKREFQLQFSLHTTDKDLRDKLIPVKKWDFKKISEYGEQFYEEGMRKITLNFALAAKTPIDPLILLKHFSPDKFLIKITPINPTYNAVRNRFSSYIDPYKKKKTYEVVNNLRSAGFEVIKSIGEVEENCIGSNCGQYIQTHLIAKEKIENGYTYTVKKNF